jgi:hypothetical protein
MAAGRANRLDLTGDDPEKAIWRKAVLSNLSLSEANIPTWQVFRLPNIEKATGLESQFHLLPCRKLPTLLTHRTEYRKEQMALFPHSKPSS